MKLLLTIILSAALLGTATAETRSSNAHHAAPHKQSFARRETSSRTWNKRGNTIKHGLQGAGTTMRDGLHHAGTTMRDGLGLKHTFH